MVMENSIIKFNNRIQLHLFTILLFKALRFTMNIILKQPTLELENIKH